MADTSIDIVGPRVMGTKTEQVPFNHNLIDGDIFPGFITKERLEQSFDTDPSDMVWRVVDSLHTPRVLAGSYWHLVPHK